MVIQCPDCQTKMRPKPPEGTTPGTKVSVTCRCGTKLRFTMPGQPVDREKLRRIHDVLDAAVRSAGPFRYQP